MTEHCREWDRMPETLSANGVGRRSMAGAGATLVMVRIPAGMVVDRHDHPHEQFVQVISGAGRLTTETGEHVFGPGSVFHFPPGTWHAARFAADTCLIETNLGR